MLFYNKIYSLVAGSVWGFQPLCWPDDDVFQDFFVQILTTAMVYYAAVVVELILVFVASGRLLKIARLLFRSSWSTQLWMALPWALSLLATCKQLSIRAFLVQSLMFYCHGNYRTRREKDLSGMGRALMGMSWSVWSSLLLWTCSWEVLEWTISWVLSLSSSLQDWQLGITKDSFMSMIKQMGQPATGWAVAITFGTLSWLYQPLYQSSSYLRKKRLIKERLSWGSCLGFLSFDLCYTNGD